MLMLMLYADANLDSISLSKFCNDTLSCHRVLVVAVVVLDQNLVLQKLKFEPVMVLVVEACQLVPIATDNNNDKYTDTDDNSFIATHRLEIEIKE